MRTLGRSSSFFVLGTLVSCGAAYGQAVTTPAEPAPVVTQSAQPAPAPEASRESRRQDIRSMEVLLTQALQTGARELARQLKVSEPNSAFVTGTGRARGFILDGHGIFFDVDVPGMRQSVIWSAQMLELERERQAMVRFLTNSSPDDPRRRMAEANLRLIERQMGAGPGEFVIANPSAPAGMAPPGRVVPMIAEPVNDSAPAARGLSQVQQLRDPNELYTDSVKMALIDVMLKFSGPLKVRDHEWLTVAATDSDGPETPGQLDETSRILISIRGADLSAFQSGKLSREDVLKKVEVKEF